MLAYRERPLEVSLENVFRLQGADPKVIRARRPALYALTEQAAAEATALLVPDLIHRRLSVRTVEPERVLLEDGFALTSPMLARRLASAQAICTVICTVGAGISERVTREMAGNQFAYGYALDCAGTIALEWLVRQFYGELEAQAAIEGLSLSHRYSPGLRSWSVTQGQPEIFAILRDRNHSVELTPSMQMQPVKSVSFVVGLGKDLKRKGSECSDCSMRSRCVYRTRCSSR